MAKTFSFDLDMNKGERSDQIVYGRAGDKQSVNIVANLKLDGATWTPPSGDVNAYFECITGDNKSIRVKATLSDSTVSVSLPTDVYSFFGIVSNAYFRVEVGSADSPTYVESSASFSVYIFGSVDTAYTAFENSADLVNWRKLNATLNEVINQANASVNAAIEAFNEQLSDNKSRIDQAVSGASQVVDEADSLRRGGLAKPLAVSDGGTGADNAAQARANLGISGSAFSGDYNDLTNKPSLFSGNYNDLTDKPSLFSGNYNDLTDKPSLFSGNYNDLTDKPSLFSGNYNDLTDKPAIPATPISVANGGTGATTAAQARANLGIQQGVKLHICTSSEYLKSGDLNVPTIAGDAATIYITPKVTAEDNDAYDQWMYVNSKWDIVGGSSNKALEANVDAITSEMEERMPVYYYSTAPTESVVKSEHTTPCLVVVKGGATYLVE